MSVRTRRFGADSRTFVEGQLRYSVQDESTAGQVLEQRRERDQLLLGVPLREEGLDARRVRVLCLVELLAPGSVRNAYETRAVAGAAAPLDVAGALQAFEQGGHPRRREQDALGQVDPPQLTSGAIESCIITSKSFIVRPCSAISSPLN